MESINIKRIYDGFSDTDGYRILVDRLWPRGVSKTKAKLDEWDKEVAPSTELRKWFRLKEERFDEFAKLYREELLAKKEELKRLQTIVKSKPVTLLYAAKNAKINHAIILKDILLNEL